MLIKILSAVINHHGEYNAVVSGGCHFLFQLITIFKGFATTIVAGISAISYSSTNVWVLALSFLPVLAFAILDVYYLKLERKFRFLFDQVRMDKHEIDFSMKLTNDPLEIISAKARTWDCIKSPSSDVKKIPDVTQPTWPCDYVDYIKNKILSSDDIYKGENSDEDISSWSEDAIWNHLKDKIYDGTITIVLISPNMKEAGKWQRSQWIPWEISYSLRETTRNDRTSHNNAILAVILPNQNSNYDYYDKSSLFPILKENIDNGYIYVVTWDDFVKYSNTDIKQAFDYREKTPTYKIKKSL